MLSTNYEDDESKYSVDTFFVQMPFLETPFEVRSKLNELEVAPHVDPAPQGEFDKVNDPKSKWNDDVFWNIF